MLLKEMQFFELLQIAIGNRSQLSRTPTAEEWREICALAKKQAMVGIAFCGVEQLPVEQRPPRKLWMQWYTAAERIKGLNAEMDRKVFKVARMFRREGFQGVVLKGQGMAQLYKVERSTVNGQRTTDGPHPNPLQGERGLGLPDEGFDLTQKAQNNCQGQGQQTTVNGQRTDHPDETLLMDHELHGLHENSGASATISHTESTESTENFCQRADAKGASVATTRTLVLQRSAGNSPNTNSQNLHDASPVRLPDEGFDLTQKAQNTQNISVNANIDTNLDSNSQNAHTQACAGRPDGTVDRRPLTVDNCSSTVDSNSLPVDTCLDSKQATFPVPNAAFNRVYILVHIYRHLFAEGIGLRQLLDYYFVLQQGFTESEREETLRVLRSLGMMRFTRAVMWMLQEVFGMPDCYLLTSPDAKEGRFLLDEIMLAGNFGKYDERMQRAAGEGTFRWGLRKVLRNFRFVRSYPSEVLWSPIFKVWHLFWRIRHA